MIPTDGGGRALEPLLGVGAALVVASQLRFAGPLGVGELLLLVYLALALRRPVAPAPGRSVLVPVYVVLTAVVVGFMNATLRGYYPDGAVRDLLALVFVGVLLHVATSRGHLTRRMIGSAALAVIGTTLLALVAARLGVLGLEPLYAGSRLRGASSNPNQLALGLSAAPFALVLLGQGSTSGRRRLGLLAAAGGAVLLGAWSRSDALAVAWFVAGVGYVVLRVARRLDRRLRLGVTVVGLVVAVGAATVLFGSMPKQTDLDPLTGLAARVAEVYAEGDQGNVRLSLWRHGLEAFVESDLLGFGPGSHSGIVAPLQGSESHNSAIDLLAAGGLLGSLGFAALVLVLRNDVGRRRRLLPLEQAMVLSLGGFAWFHNVLRHPLWWLLLATAIVGVRRFTPPMAPVSASATAAEEQPAGAVIGVRR